MSQNDALCALFNLVDEVAEINDRVQEIEKNANMPLECKALLRDTMLKLKECKDNLFNCSLGMKK